MTSSNQNLLRQVESIGLATQHYLTLIGQWPDIVAKVAKVEDDSLRRMLRKLLRQIQVLSKTVTPLELADEDQTVDEVDLSPAKRRRLNLDTLLSKEPNRPPRSRKVVDHIELQPEPLNHSHSQLQSQQQQQQQSSSSSSSPLQRSPSPSSTGAEGIEAIVKRYQAELSSLATGHTHHKGAYHCPVCSVQLQYLASMKVHLRLHLPTRRHQCAHCGYASNVLQDYTMHVRNKHSNLYEYQCLRCFVVFDDEPGFQEHCMVEHGEGLL